MLLFIEKRRIYITIAETSVVARVFRAHWKLQMFNPFIGGITRRDRKLLSRSLYIIYIFRRASSAVNKIIHWFAQIHGYVFASLNLFRAALLRVDFHGLHAYVLILHGVNRVGVAVTSYQKSSITRRRHVWKFAVAVVSVDQNIKWFGGCRSRLKYFI